MVNTNNIITNIIGKKKNIKDSDGDGVTDKDDCQKFNTMRQDAITTQGLRTIQYNIATRSSDKVKKYKEYDIKSKI